MKVFLVVALFAVLAAAGGIVSWLVYDKGQLQTDLAKSQAEVKKLSAESQTLRTERDKLKSENKQLEQKVATTSQMAGASGTGLAASGGSQANNPVMGAAGGKPLKSNAMAEMMKDPAMREMAKQQQIAMIDLQYAGLFSQFQLDPAEKANFKQLLGERLAMESDFGMKMMDDKLTPAQRSALVKQMQDSKKGINDKIRTFLNSDQDYQTFDHWENTKNERMQVSMGQSAFTGMGEPLTPQQEQQLVNDMHKVRTTPGSVPDMSRPENFDPARFTPADVEKQMATVDANAELLRQRARAYLSPKQMEALNSMLEQQRSMTKYGLDMARRMYQNK